MNDSLDIAALGTHTGHQKRHVTNTLPHLPELLTHMGLPADTVTDKTLLKPKGVTQAFGEQRIKEEGANLLTPPPQEPEWKKFLKRSPN